MSKQRLGKGLGALLADPIEQPKSHLKDTPTKKEILNQILDLELDQIHPNPNQPRTIFDQETLLELSQSLQKVGLIEPIVVKKIDNKYELIAGERRWRAAKLAGFSTIPVIVKNDEKTQNHIFEIMLIENIQREDLSPLEIAVGIQNLLDTKNYTHDEMATELGKSRSYVTNVLRLLKLPNEIKELINNKKLSMGQAKMLVGLGKEEQLQLANKIINEGLSSRKVEEMVQNKNPDKKAISDVSRETKKNVELEAIEKKIRDYFQTKVRILETAKGTGKIEIEYYNYQDLNTVLSKLNISN